MIVSSQNTGTCLEIDAVTMARCSVLELFYMTTAVRHCLVGQHPIYADHCMNVTACTVLQVPRRVCQQTCTHLDLMLSVCCCC